MRRTNLPRTTAAFVAVALLAGVLALGSRSTGTSPDLATLLASMEGPRAARLAELAELAGVTLPAGAKGAEPAGAAQATAPQPPEVLPPGAELASATPPAAEPAPPPAPALPTEAPRRGASPVGKGMWIWLPEQVEGGDVNALVARALAVGLTHIYVRTGSTWQGFHGAEFLNRILPAAHAAGLRVYGWDFPRLIDPAADMYRAVTAIRYTTPDGHRIDGFVPDIETSSEGTTYSNALVYSHLLREAVGWEYPLIACVPRPTQSLIDRGFPYAQMIPYYDAVAPMVYWLNRQPDTDVTGALAYLNQFGRPVIPVGQAYDGAPEGGRPGPPPADEIRRFVASAWAGGAAGVSFWSWQHATQEIWDTIAAAPEFTLPTVPLVNLEPLQVRVVQVLLASLGYRPSASGEWDLPTASALVTFQSDLGLTPTGSLDPATRGRLLGPLTPRLPPWL